MNPVEDQCHQYRLANGMTIYHLNKHETDFTYKEIFQDQIYLKHGITLKDKACIFDVGANIGLFVLFAKQSCPEAKIFAFEPGPEACRVLRLNTAQYGSSVQVYQCGISDEEKKDATFTYYPNYSIMSGFHADPEKDKKTLSVGVRNQMQESVPSGRLTPDRLAALIVNEKLKEARQFKCEMRTISGILRDTRVERLNLLKIDAEQSELEVLKGIDASDWPRIDQIVMEAHNEHQSQAAISLLQTKGFKVHTEQEEQFMTSGITNIFAMRP